MAALPKIAVPKFKLKLPSNGKEILYRPFLVKEEKTLLMAIEGGEDNDVTEAVINIIDACVDYDGNVRELPFFDVEYIFVQLRAKSINNIIKLNLKHGSATECKHVTEYELNLENVKIEIPEDFSKNIQLTDDVGLVLKLPSLETSSKIGTSLTSSKIESVFEALSLQVESVYDQENVYDDFTQEEMIDYLGQLNKEQFLNVVGFFEKMPTVSYDVKYTCEACGKDEIIPMRGLQSFFMYR